MRCALILRFGESVRIGNDGVEDGAHDRDHDRTEQRGQESIDRQTVHQSRGYRQEDDVHDYGEQSQSEDDHRKRQHLQDGLEDGVDQAKDEGDQQDLPDIGRQIDSGHKPGRYPEGGGVYQDFDDEIHAVDGR